MQVLIPQPFMGTIIGTGGTKIKELRSVREGDRERGEVGGWEDAGARVYVCVCVCVWVGGWVCVGVGVCVGVKNNEHMVTREGRGRV